MALNRFNTQRMDTRRHEKRVERHLGLRVAVDVRARAHLRSHVGEDLADFHERGPLRGVVAEARRHRQHHRERRVLWKVRELGIVVYAAGGVAVACAGCVWYCMASSGCLHATARVVQHLRLLDTIAR